MRRCFERGAKEAAAVAIAVAVAVTIAVAVAVAVVVDGRSELGVPVSRLTPAFFKSQTRAADCPKISIVMEKMLARSLGKDEGSFQPNAKLL